MKPYAALTFHGKLRRLHQLAISALESYDLDHPRLEYHTFSTNLLYRVSTPSGERFILRMASPGWRTYEDLLAEALWLEALDRDTSIPVPVIHPTRSGELVVQMADPGIPKVWNASLMRWLPGRLLVHYLTPPNLEKMGALFALLHHHGASWKPPAGFTTRRFEHWLSRGEPNLLVDPQKSPAIAALPPASQAILEQLHLSVEGAYADIERSDLRVIHSDLWHENIKLYHGRLAPFDFEDTLWGFRVHDIAMAMLDLLEATDDLRYAELLASFQRGYTADLAWPADPLEPFQIGRLLWKVNWFARFRPERIPKLVEAHLPVFQLYLQSGRIIRPPAVIFE
jgi:Ser/Thr protein kinase RdoA (MazF antagonist)